MKIIWCSWDWSNTHADLWFKAFFLGRDLVGPEHALGNPGTTWRAWNPGYEIHWTWMWKMWKYVLDGKIGRCEKLNLYTAKQGQHDFLNHEIFGPTHLGQNGQNPSWWTKRPRTHPNHPIAGKWMCKWMCNDLHPKNMIFDAVKPTML